MSSPLMALPERVGPLERPAPPEDTLARAVRAAAARLFSPWTGFRARRLSRILAAVTAASGDLAGLDDDALAQAGRRAGAALRLDPNWSAVHLARALAVVREAASRRLGLRAHDVQIIGAYTLLRGMVAEMATGEGKTLTAGLAAATAALAGVPVHVVTVNSYLAKRDAEGLAPLYAFFGLSVGAVHEGLDATARRASYRCAIAYCTNKDLVFDYLRDTLRLGRRSGALRAKSAALVRSREAEPPLLRGLHFAIVDEADSVLIDEARTPLILAGVSDCPRDVALFDAALAIAGRLQAVRDYLILPNERRIVLTERGRLELVDAVRLGAPWDEIAERELLATQALTALQLMRPGEHYLVRDGAVAIVDEYTGRVLPDRTWSEGLHEMIERKEGLDLSDRHATQARITYQRFFPRYRKLAGMTGTAREVVEELWRVYRLPVATLPTHKPVRRRSPPAIGHFDRAAKWRAVVAEAAQLQGAGAAVLIGARTVAEADYASAALTDAGLPHVTLSARQDAEEATIISAAGRSGAVTVATNMAGRGADIRPDAAALAQGGLHVFLTEPHEAARIDRQLAGRSARQGEPGVLHTHFSLDDAILRDHAPPWRLAFLRRLPGGVAGPLTVRLARAAQARAERVHARIRRELLLADHSLGDILAFTGDRE